MQNFVWFICLAVFSNVTLAADWLCKEAASERRGNSIFSCGIGLGRTESEARIAALKESKREFAELCNGSADCKGHSVIINPSRNDCRKKGSQYECYRGVEYVIGSADLSPASDAALDSEIAATEAKLLAIRTRKAKEQRLRELKNEIQATESQVNDTQVTETRAVEAENRGKGTDLFERNATFCTKAIFNETFARNTTAMITPDCAGTFDAGVAKKDSARLFRMGIALSCGFFYPAYQAALRAEAQFKLGSSASSEIRAQWDSCKADQQSKLENSVEGANACEDSTYIGNLLMAGRDCADVVMKKDETLFKPLYVDLCSKKKPKAVCAKVANEAWLQSQRNVAAKAN